MFENSERWFVRIYNYIHVPLVYMRACVIFRHTGEASLSVVSTRRFHRVATVVKGLIYVCWLSFGSLFVSLMMSFSEDPRWAPRPGGSEGPATLAVNRGIFLGAPRPVEGHRRHWPPWPSIISYPDINMGHLSGLLPYMPKVFRDVWVWRWKTFMLYLSTFMIFSTLSDLKVVLNGHDQDHSRIGFLFVILQIPSFTVYNPHGVGLSWLLTILAPYIIYR